MNPNWTIGLIVVLLTTHYSVMGFEGYDPSLQAERLMTLSLAFLYAWWAHEDAKKRKYHRPYEFGAFIFFAWPIVLPIYLVTTRGWKGMITFFIFVVIFYLPEITGWIFYYLNPSNF